MCEPIRLQEILYPVLVMARTVSPLCDLTIRLLESGEIFLEANEKKVSEIS